MARRARSTQRDYSPPRLFNYARPRTSQSQVRWGSDTSSDFTVVLINAQSVLPKMESLRHLAASQKPSLIIVNESWGKPKDRDTKFSIRGYSFVRQDRKRYDRGGNLIYALIELNIRRISTGRFQFKEHLLAECMLPNTGETLNVLAVYRTTMRDMCMRSGKNIASTELTHENDAKLDQLLRYTTGLKGHTLVCGDFNLTSLRWGTGGGSKPESGADMEMYSVISDNGLHNIVRQPTRNGNILDIILVKNPSINKGVTISAPLEASNGMSSSDHNIVSARLIWGLSASGQYGQATGSKGPNSRHRKGKAGNSHDYRDADESDSEEESDSDDEEDDDNDEYDDDDDDDYAAEAARVQFRRLKISHRL